MKRSVKDALSHLDPVGFCLGCSHPSVGMSLGANWRDRLCLSVCYNLSLEQKPLIETNPYLRDPKKFRKALITSVASSTAIETGAPIASIVRMLEEREETKRPPTTPDSSR